MKAKKNSRHQEDAGCGLWGSDPFLGGGLGRNLRASYIGLGFLAGADGLCTHKPRAEVIAKKENAPHAARSGLESMDFGWAVCKRVADERQCFRVMGQESAIDLSRQRKLPRHRKIILVIRAHLPNRISPKFFAERTGDFERNHILHHH